MCKIPLFYPNIRSYILHCIVYKILTYNQRFDITVNTVVLIVL